MAIGVAGLVFVCGLTAKIPLQQLLTPLSIGIMIAIGLVVSAVDLLIVLRNPERLAIARGEKLPSPEFMQQLQQRMSYTSSRIMLGALILAGLILFGMIVLAVFWR